MLAVSPLGNTTATKDEDQGQMESFSFTGCGQEFPDFSDGSLLESIDFDDLFVGINDGDVLPDLELGPEILAEFSVSGSGDESDINTSVSNEKVEGNPRKDDQEDKVSGSGSVDFSLSNRGEEIVSKRTEPAVVRNPVAKNGEKSRKPSTQAKNTGSTNQGKRKMKVDWTPELHRRFVQAVEQLGVDKAVPSRILELMGIDCLTRHNIASHLQKYRSHRKHLLAREAEATSWNQRRIYGAAAAGGGGSKDTNHWHAPPTIGFPPMRPPMHHQFRPLHVWGHPSMDHHSLVHMWPRHPAHSPSPTPPPPPPPTAWHPPPSLNPSFWRHHHQRVPNVLTPGTPCFPHPLTPPPTRFATPPVSGIPSHAMYRVEAGTGVPPGHSGSHRLLDNHPSKESVDAAIGDVLSKPWLPFPLGLKPPSVDGVLVELQRQGITKIPPKCA